MQGTGVGNGKALYSSKATTASGMLAPEISFDHVMIPPDACARVFLAKILPVVLICMYLLSLTPERY